MRMCTLAIFANVFEDYPLLVAANRDERYDRPSMAPAMIATDPKILAGKDLTAGGTWLGVNEWGLLVGILNRRARREDFNRPGARSRGLLCLDLLALRSVGAAAEFLRDHSEIYNPFTIVYGDGKSLGVAFNNANEIIQCFLDPGLHVFSSAAEIDTASGKADRAYHRFINCAPELAPKKTSARWLGTFKTLLGDHTSVSEEYPRDAVCVHGPESGTVSSSIIHYCAVRRRFETYFCAGPPCQNFFNEPLVLDVL